MGVVLDTPWIGQQFSPPTPIDINTIDAAIVARIVALVPLIDVVDFPDNPKNYRLTNAVGAALVAYRGSEYGKVNDTASIVQERTMQFDVNVLVRDLGWSVGGAPGGTSPGAYAILEAIRAALTKYQIPGARKIFMVREKFIGRDADGGVWMYLLTIALITMALEPSTTEDFPLFIKGIALEANGESTVTIGVTQFTFNSQDQIQLPNGNIIALTVSALGGSAFVLDTDFTLDPADGIVTRLVSGGIASGASVSIAWSYGDAAIASAGESAPFV